ncbi:MAG: ABC transporter permease [Lachnospiraceae bacterium]|nr:ABC transporter permease [Lachnospiraceae bacterium]
MEHFAIEEYRYNFKINFKSIIITFFLSITGIVCMGLAITLLLQTSDEVEKYKETFEEKQYYTIMDNFVGDNESELTGEESLICLKEFSDLVRNSEYFDYYMLYDQQVYIEDYKGNEKNIYGYEYSADLDKMTKKLPAADGSNKICTCVKGFWMGENVINDFGIQIQKGACFEQKDFTLTTESPISVILGSNYADEYEMGESIYVDFIFAAREAKVIGILEEGANLYYRGKFVNLDRCVIMPIFLNDDYNGQALYRFETNHFYTLRNSGLIATKLSMEDIQEIITEYSEKAGFATSYYVTEYDGTSKKTFSIGIRDIQFLLTLLSVLITAIALMLLTIFYLNKIKRNKRYYAILMMNGSNKKQIYGILFCEIVLLIFFAYVLGTAIVISLSPLTGTDLLMTAGLLFVSSLLFGLVPLLSSTLVFFKSDLVQYMMEEI